MQDHITKIENFWQNRESIAKNAGDVAELKKLINEIFAQLETGQIAVTTKEQNNWQVNEWIKKAILLKFKISGMKISGSEELKWYDKIDQLFTNYSESDFQKAACRVVPGAFVREGSYIGQNTIIMPSFINVGAYIGSGTMIDSWATIGSCAYIGKNCHISGGAGIGGVLEPLQALPVIIEDKTFIGARSEIVEGVIIREGCVISMGVFIGQSTKIVYRDTGKIIYGEIPPYSVVVPGTLPAREPNLPSLYCAVIIKQVDKKTRDKTSINEILRS